MTALAGLQDNGSPVWTAQCQPTARVEDATAFPRHGDGRLQMLHETMRQDKIDGAILDRQGGDVPLLELDIRKRCAAGALTRHRQPARMPIHANHQPRRHAFCDIQRQRSRSASRVEDTHPSRQIRQQEWRLINQAALAPAGGVQIAHQRPRAYASQAARKPAWLELGWPETPGW